MTIKVLIVDDSALVRQVLSGLLKSDPELDIIRPASDPFVAMDRMQHEWPDVIVLDIEMPRMDGLTFLRKLMAERPTPVVVCSSLTERGARTSIDALAAGAVSIVEKPKLELKNFLLASANDLINAVKTAARANLSRLAPHAPLSAPSTAPAIPKHTADVILPQSRPSALNHGTETIVAIGTSTGGTLALEEVLTALPRTAPALLIVQHMPQNFTLPFARRLNSLCQIEVKEAEPNDAVTAGRALIAPAGQHMLLRRAGTQYFVEVIDGPPVNRHRPSVDVLFRSVARCAGPNAIGILMTGMGDDGAAGLLEMRQAGATTIAQDEASSVVYGMPKEAVKRGAATKILPLDAMARAIILQNDA